VREVFQVAIPICGRAKRQENSQCVPGTKIVCMKFREMVRDEVEDRNKGYFKLYRYIEF
jgi:hypothetical protein